jgi:hypothetical protein
MGLVRKMKHSLWWLLDLQAKSFTYNVVSRSMDPGQLIEQSRARLLDWNELNGRMHAAHGWMMDDG